MPPSYVSAGVLASTYWNPEKLTYYTNGLYWVWYWTGSNEVYRTSSDGSSWGTAVIYPPSGIIDYAQVGLWYDSVNTKICMARISGSGRTSVYYRQGVLTSTGLINWDTDENLITSSAVACYHPTVCLDSNNNPWASFTDGNSVEYFTSGSATGSTWSTPLALWTNRAGGAERTRILPMSSGRVMALSCVSDSAATKNVQFRVMTGSNGALAGHWSPAANASSGSTQYYWNFDAVNDGDNVALAFVSGSGEVAFNFYTHANPTGSWLSTDEIISATGTTGKIQPAITFKAANNYRVFYLSGSAYIVYKDRTSGTWGGQTTVSNETIGDYECLTSCYASVSNNICLAWTSGSSPYGIYFQNYFLGVTYTTGSTDNIFNFKPKLSSLNDNSIKTLPKFTTSTDNLFIVVAGPVPPTSVTIGSGSSNAATSYPCQRKGFFAANLMWLFFSDGANMVYSTSSAGTVWNTSSGVRACTSGEKFDIHFDGTYMHYAFAPATAGGKLQYRRGTPNTDGTITWSASEQVAYNSQNSPGVSVEYIYYPSVGVDSNNYPYISFGYNETVNLITETDLTKSSTNDGTWSTAATFPKTLYSLSNIPSEIVPLTNGRMYVVYGLANDIVRGRLFSGSTLNNEETGSSGNLKQVAYLSATSINDDVHLTYLKSTNDISYVKRTYSTGLWNTGSETTIQAGATTTSAPCISSDTGSANLYVFWAGYPTTNHVYYKTGSGGIWSSNIDWQNESSEVLTANDRLTSFFRTNNGILDLEYSTKTSSLYNIKAALFPLPLDSYLIGYITNISNGVTWTGSMDTKYIAIIFNQRNKTTFSNDIVALSNWQDVLRWSARALKLGIENQTTIQTALDNSTMINGMPSSSADGTSVYYSNYDGEYIYGFYWANKFNYQTAKWNINTAYANYHSAWANFGSGFLWYSGSTNVYGGTSRFYDEHAETMRTFLLFKEFGMSNALTDAQSEWDYINSTHWVTSGSSGYFTYTSPASACQFECEAGGFLEIIAYLRTKNPLINNYDRLRADVEFRFLQSLWSSFQWTFDGSASNYAVVHCHESNNEVRLSNTIMAWAAIMGTYDTLSATGKSNVQTMLSGSSTAVSGWNGFINNSTLYDSTNKQFKDLSTAPLSNDATARGVALLFFLGIVPTTAELAIPVEELHYEYSYNIFDPDLFNINITNRTITFSLLKSGNVKFIYGPVSSVQTFNQNGVWQVTFNNMWIPTGSSRSGDLPTNRHYLSEPITAYLDNSIKIAPKFVGFYEKFVKTSPTFSSVNDELTRTLPKLLSVNDELTKTSPKLSSINDEIIKTLPKLTFINDEPIKIYPKFTQSGIDNYLKLMAIYRSQLDEIIKTLPKLSSLNDENFKAQPKLLSLNDESLKISPKFMQHNDKPLKILPQYASYQEEILTALPRLIQYSYEIYKILVKFQSYNDEIIKINPKFSQITDQTVKILAKLMQYSDENIRLTPRLISYADNSIKLFARLQSQTDEIIRVLPKLQSLTDEFVKMVPKFVSYADDIIRVLPKLLGFFDNSVKVSPKFLAINDEYIRINPLFLLQRDENIRILPKLLTYADSIYKILSRFQDYKDEIIKISPKFAQQVDEILKVLPKMMSYFETNTKLTPRLMLQGEKLFTLVAGFNTSQFDKIIKVSPQLKTYAEEFLGVKPLFTSYSEFIFKTLPKFSFYNDNSLKTSPRFINYQDEFLKLMPKLMQYSDKIYKILARLQDYRDEIIKISPGFMQNVDEALKILPKLASYNDKPVKFTPQMVSYGDKLFTLFAHVPGAFITTQYDEILRVLPQLKNSLDQLVKLKVTFSSYIDMAFRIIPKFQMQNDEILKILPILKGLQDKTLKISPKYSSAIEQIYRVLIGIPLYGDFAIKFLPRLFGNADKYFDVAPAFTSYPDKIFSVLTLFLRYSENGIKVLPEFSSLKDFLVRINPRMQLYSELLYSFITARLTWLQDYASQTNWSSSISSGQPDFNQEGVATGWESSGGTSPAWLSPEDGKPDFKEEGEEKYIN